MARAGSLCLLRRPHSLGRGRGSSGAGVTAERPQRRSSPPIAATALLLRGARPRLDGWAVAPEAAERPACARRSLGRGSLQAQASRELAQRAEEAAAAGRAGFRFRGCLHRVQREPARPRPAPLTGGLRLDSGAPRPDPAARAEPGGRREDVVRGRPGSPPGPACRDRVQEHCPEVQIEQLSSWKRALHGGMSGIPSSGDARRRLLMDGNYLQSRCCRCLLESTPSEEGLGMVPLARHLPASKPRPPAGRVVGPSCAGLGRKFGVRIS